VVKALEGFYVKEIRVTGSKEARAEPWSAQLAAGNVALVEDGTWDILEYVEEHCLFPLGKFLDLVDASSGGFNLLVNRRAAGTVRVLGLSSRRNKNRLTVVVCARDEIATLPVEDRKHLVLSVLDPGEEDAAPVPTPLTRLDTATLRFADLDPSQLQDRWEAPVEPYGAPPGELVMTREEGKDLWKFLLKSRDRTPEVFVICDGGDGRALSVAYGVVDALRIPRSAVFRTADPDSKCEDAPPNDYVYHLTKESKGMVCA